MVENVSESLEEIAVISEILEIVGSAALADSTVRPAGAIIYLAGRLGKCWDVIESAHRATFEATAAPQSNGATHEEHRDIASPPLYQIVP